MPPPKWRKAGENLEMAYVWYRNVDTQDFLAGDPEAPGCEPRL
jgi:hypothetical protein